MEPITAEMTGCWFSGASHRTADELNLAVIDCALGRDWNPDDKETLALVVLPENSGWFDSGDDSEIASNAAREACDYLNSLAPNGYMFGFDDGFYLLAVCEWEMYEPDADYPCPHGDDCPNV